MISNALVQRAALARQTLLNQALQKKEANPVKAFLNSPYTNLPPKIDETEIVRWSADDQMQIDAVMKVFDQYPAMRLGGAGLIKEILEGPNTLRAQTGKLQYGLRLMLNLIETQYQLEQTANDSEPIPHQVKETTHADEILNDEAQYQWSPFVQSLIDWFVTNEHKLPTTEFALSAYETITNTSGFYARIKIDIAAKPNKFSGDYLHNKLEKLRNIVEIETGKNQSMSAKATLRTLKNS